MSGNGLDRDLSPLWPVNPGPQPVEPQVQEEVEPVRQVLTDTHGCALIPRRFTEARPVMIGEFFTRHPAPTVLVTRGGVEYRLPLIDVPRADLWGVELLHEDGEPTLAAYYWNNEVGFRFFAYLSRETAVLLADNYALRQEVTS